MLAVHEVGASEGAPVVFLHGAGLGAWMWNPQAAGLPNHRCLLVDLPAHGSSRHVLWRSLAETADAVADAIRRVAPGRPVHVVGLSLGAVGYELLRRHPDVVDSMVVTGGLGVGVAGGRLIEWLMGACVPLARIGPVAAATVALARIPRADRPAARASLGSIDASQMRIMLKDVFAYRLPSEFADRPHRVLGIAGALEHPSMGRTLRRLRELMQHATTAFVPGGLHAWPWQYPALCTEVIDAWVGGRPVPDRLRIRSG